MSKTDNRHIGSTFSERTYNIPYYQRNYVWGQKEIEDLLQDIDFVREENVNHYFGNLVLDLTEDSEDSEYSEYEIIDGQQRITTLTILFSNIYWFIEENIKNKTDGLSLDEDIESKIKDIQRRCKDVFLKSSGYEMGEDSLMLKTAEQQEDMYKSVILKHPDERTYEPSRFSERNLDTVSNEIWNWIEQIYEEASGRTESKVETTVKELDDISIKVKSSFNLTEYVVQGDSEAGRIFGVLNDRGKSLNIADKVKSTLVYHTASVLDDSEMVQEIHNTFAHIYEKVLENNNDGRSDMNSFMKNHWRLFVGTTPENLDNLHRIITNEPSHLDRKGKSEEHQRDWIKGYIESLKEASNAYYEITNYNSKTEDETQMLIDTLNYYLQNICSCDFTPLQLAAHICLTQSEQKEVLLQIERISIRNQEIARRGTNTFRSTAIQNGYKLYWVYNNNSETRLSSTEVFHSKKGQFSGTTGERIREIKKKAKRKYNTDEIHKEIKDYLSSGDILSGSQKVNWGGLSRGTAKYILLRINGIDGYPYIWTEGEDNIELEHIRPESKKVDDCSNLVNAFGNLCVIEKKYNTKCQDKKLKDKLKFYRKSGLKMTAELEKISRSSWTDENIRERTEKILRDGDTVGEFFEVF